MIIYSYRSRSATQSTYITSYTEASKLLHAVISSNKFSAPFLTRSIRIIPDLLHSHFSYLLQSSSLHYLHFHIWFISLSLSLCGPFFCKQISVIFSPLIYLYIYITFSPFLYILRFSISLIILWLLKRLTYSVIHISF